LTEKLPYKSATNLKGRRHTKGEMYGQHRSILNLQQKPGAARVEASRRSSAAWLSRHPAARTAKIAGAWYRLEQSLEYRTSGIKGEMKAL